MNLDVSAIQEPYTNVTTYIQSQALPHWIQEIKLLVLFFRSVLFWLAVFVPVTSVYQAR